MVGITASKIITGGLGVNYKACEGLITTHFSLYCVPIEPPVEPPVGGGGGNIGTFPDRTERWDIDAPRSIVIRIQLKKKLYERVYTVSSKRAEFIIKITNIINRTREKISITVSNLRRAMLSVIAKLTNKKN